MSRPTPLGPDGDEESLTLYCLPHAGGSAVPYTRWNAILPSSVRVEPLELPGHGGRLREPLIQRMDLLVAELVRSMKPRKGAPFALFGHSFGALVSFELARRLQQFGTPPTALLVGGRNGPGEPLSHRPIHHLPDDSFVTSLRRFGGMPQALLDQPELLRMYLPALRADLKIVETYSRSPGPALDLPVVTYGGRRDVLTDPAGLLAWERETTKAFDLTLVPGGHFFLDEPDFHDALSSRLGRLVKALSSSSAPMRRAGAGPGAGAGVRTRRSTPARQPVEARRPV